RTTEIFTLSLHDALPILKNGVHIWDDWPLRFYKESMEKEGKTPLSREEFLKNIVEDDAFAKKWGELGPVYGYQWRHWPTKDGGRSEEHTSELQSRENLVC